MAPPVTRRQSKRLLLDAERQDANSTSSTPTTPESTPESAPESTPAAPPTPSTPEATPVSKKQRTTAPQSHDDPVAQLEKVLATKPRTWRISQRLSDLVDAFQSRVSTLEAQSEQELHCRGITPSDIYKAERALDEVKTAMRVASKLKQDALSAYPLENKWWDYGYEDLLSDTWPSNGIPRDAWPVGPDNTPYPEHSKEFNEEQKIWIEYGQQERENYKEFEARQKEIEDEALLKVYQRAKEIFRFASDDAVTATAL